LELAWLQVKQNKGQGYRWASLEEFEATLNEQLDASMLNSKRCLPVLPVRQQLIEGGQPESLHLGIPTIYDRCQQALLNRLEPIFEKVFDDASFGYRRGRSAKDALRKIWGELESGNAWIVDADLKDFFGSVDHEKLLTLVSQRVSDGRVLHLIQQMLKAACLPRANGCRPSRVRHKAGWFHLLVMSTDSV
jgi:retron-type reverse transcriptase